MASVIEYILGVSGSVLLVAWVALLAGAVFWRPASTLDRPGWLAARCRTGAPTGLALTAAVLTLATSAWSLAFVTFSVVHHTGLARDDPRVLAFFTGHRAPWITGLAKVLTWLGSSIVLWPVVVIAGLGLWRWRRRWLPAVLPALALAGAWAGALLIKGLVDRPRPPVGDRLTVVHGWSYPGAGPGHLGDAHAHADGGALATGPDAAGGGRRPDRVRGRADAALPGRPLDDGRAGRLGARWGVGRSADHLLPARAADGGGFTRTGTGGGVPEDSIGAA